MKWLKRILVTFFMLGLIVVQVGYVNGVAPWMNLLFLFTLIYVAYARTPRALGVATLGGFLSEAYAIQQSGVIFISFLFTALIMFILEKTILSRASIFSVGILVVIGSTIFGVGMYLHTVITSTLFLNHPVDVASPFALITLYYITVPIVFITHAIGKATLDRFYPKIHRSIYGDAL